MALIRELQDQHLRWLHRNFPDQTPHQALLGIMEEVGELAHAHLKEEQGIRGMNAEESMTKKQDAVGDIFIFLLSYCNTNGLDFEMCVMVAWADVNSRDWVRFPTDGRTH